MRFLVSIIALVAASMLAPVVDAQTQAATAAVPSPTFSTDPRTACGADAHRLCQNETSIVGFGDDDDDDNHGHGHGHDDDDDDDDDDDRRRCRSNKCPQRPLTALQCLYRHRRRLSPNCAAVVAGTPYSKCQNDIARLCSYAGTDLAEIQYCITNNKVVLSNQCYSAISTQDVSGAMVTSSSSVVAAGDDPRPICGADADRFCDNRVRSPPSPSTCYSRPETGLQCVLRHYNRLQPQCKTLVAQRPLYQCRNDIAAYCQYANGELEETKWCVLHHVVLLSQPCADALKADANAAASEFKQECLPSAQAVCPLYIGNFPVLLNCLLTNFGQLQPVCQQAIKARVANN